MPANSSEPPIKADLKAVRAALEWHLSGASPLNVPGRQDDLDAFERVEKALRAVTEPAPDEQIKKVVDALGSALRSDHVPLPLSPLLFEARQLLLRTYGLKVQLDTVLAIRGGREGQLKKAVDLLAQAHAAMVPRTTPGLGLWTQIDAFLNIMRPR